MPLTDRNDLTNRVIPHMTFGDGTGLNVPPPPPPKFLPSEDRARERFSVEGNAIVTGGGGMLGLEAARALLEHGLSGLMLFDVNPDLLKTAEAELQSDFPLAVITSRVVDVTDEEGVNLAVVTTASVLGSVDILLCFAGVVA